MTWARAYALTLDTIFPLVNFLKPGQPSIPATDSQFRQSNTIIRHFSLAYVGQDVRFFSYDAFHRTAEMSTRISREDVEET
jgi:hypothetical protein